jgi:IclR family acetate operon transcriptional repressor
MVLSFIYSFRYTAYESSFHVLENVMVQSIDRTLDILEALALADDDVSISALQAQLGLPFGTLHRLLSALTERGYAIQSLTTRHYGPGPKLLEIATHAAKSRRFSLQQIAKPHLQGLTAATGETSNLVLLQNNEIVYLDQVASSRLVRMFTEAGRHAPLYSTGAGKAILSTFAPQQLDAYLEHTLLAPTTPHTITSREQLRDELARTQARGFAIDDEEYEEGVRCAAAPVFDRHGRCIAALSISGPTTRISRPRIYEVGAQVRAAAQACSRELGYHDANHSLDGVAALA